MSLDKNLTNRIFRIAIQAESAVIIRINQQASEFGTDVSGQFFASAQGKFAGPIPACLRQIPSGMKRNGKSKAAAGCRRQLWNAAKLERRELMESGEPQQRQSAAIQRRPSTLAS